MADAICGSGWTGCHATLAYGLLALFALLAASAIAVAIGNR